MEKNSLDRLAPRWSAVRTAVLPALLGGIACGLISTEAHAAAYYVGEIGARSTARGGAHVVRPDGSAAAWLNPAAISLSPGLTLDVDLNLVFLDSRFTRDCGGQPNGCAPAGPLKRDYTGLDGAKHSYVVNGERSPTSSNVSEASAGSLGNLGTPSRFDGTTSIRNQAGVQPIPRLMLTANGDLIGIEGAALAAYVYAPNNGDYSFGADTPTRYTLIDRDLLEVFYGLAVAYRLGDWIGLGAGFQLVTAGVNQSVRLSADQYGNEDPNYDVQVRIQGQQDFIPSGNIGIWANPGALLGIGNLELAGSAQLGRQVKTTGALRVESIGEGLQSEFIDSGLVAFQLDGATANAEFELPPLYRAGVRYGLDDITADGKNTVAFDVEAAFIYEQWSVYDHVYLATTGATVDLNTKDQEPGTELPPIVQPKDWTDAWSIRLGGTMALWDRTLEVHGGGFYETSAIPNPTYSVELVCGDKIGFGSGISGTLWGVRLDVAYSHIFVFDRAVGTESIVFNGSSGSSVLATGETRTRVAMGKYSAGFDMINVALRVGFDELFGFGNRAN